MCIKCIIQAVSNDEHIDDSLINQANTRILYGFAFAEKIIFYLFTMMKQV